MNEKIKKLFLENPGLEDEIYAFCKQLPELEQAHNDCYALLRQVEASMGYSFSAQMEETINYYWSFLTKAYYLFGLGLRQDVLGVLMG